MPISTKQVNIVVMMTMTICLARVQVTSIKHELHAMHKHILNNYGVSLEYMVQEYAKVCRYEDTFKENASIYYDFNCPECSGQPDCLLHDECCPDVIYGYLNYECVSVVKRVESNLYVESYLMVSSCPETSSYSGSSDDTPVTSLATGITYKTKQFAICNSDENALVQWNATVSCFEYPFTDEVQVNSLEDLLQHFSKHTCEVIYQISDKNVPSPATCGGLDYLKNKELIIPRKLIQNCNETGFWEYFDQSIDFACRQLTLPYRIYKNVFCFICNPGLSFKYHETKPIIRTCHLSERNDSLGLKLQSACLRKDENPYHLPFKNLYCKRCNMAYRNFDAISEGFHETWIHVRDVYKNTVAKIVGELFYTLNSSLNDNSSYIETKLNLDMNYNETIYACSIPVHTIASESHCNDRDSVCTENNICKQENQPFYNCTGMFRNNIISRDDKLDAYDKTFNNRDFLYNYILEMYLCEESVTENTFCSASVERQICSQPAVTGQGPRTSYNRDLSCLICKTGSKYDHWYENLTERIEILIKISCSNLLEEWSYIDIFSLLESARDCSIKFIPSGVIDTDYSRIFNDEDLCYDIPFIDRETCKNTQGSYYFGSYRKLFSLPGNDWKALVYAKRQVPTNVTRCTETFGSSDNRTTESCREILCSDGHVLVNDSCISEYEMYVNAQYEITYGFSLSDINGANCGNKMTINISDICKGVQGEVVNMIGNNTSFSVESCTVNLNFSCSKDFFAEITIGLNMEISITVLIDFTTELTEVERRFVASLTQSINFEVENDNICSLKLIPLSRETSLGTKPHCRFKSEYVKNASYVLKKTFVNKLLTCSQINLLENEFEIDNTSNRLFLTDNGIHVKNYMIRHGRVRICLEDFKTYVQIPIQVSTFLEMYKLVDNICTILSLLCLSVTFFTYCIFSSLRTVPGVNNMSLTFSLFFAQLTVKLGIWQPTNSIICPLFGILIHFFWLTTFCSMNVCSFHMNRVFSSNTMVQSVFTLKTRVQYLIVTYMSPSAMILLTIGTHLTLSNGYSIGYGKTICFLTDTETVIVAFLCPCVIVFLTNILFFVKTIISLRRAFKNSLVRRSDDRRNFIIYLRLWTLLGITWPLLIVDAMSDISFFSYIALSFNTLQGLFIFISFVCNKRVLGMYRKWLTFRVIKPDA